MALWRAWTDIGGYTLEGLGETPEQAVEGLRDEYYRETASWTDRTGMPFSEWGEYAEPNVYRLPEMGEGQCAETAEYVGYDERMRLYGYAIKGER